MNTRKVLLIPPMFTPRRNEINYSANAGWILRHGHMRKRPRVKGERDKTLGDIQARENTRFQENRQGAVGRGVVVLTLLSMLNIAVCHIVPWTMIQQRACPDTNKTVFIEFYQSRISTLIVEVILTLVSHIISHSNILRTVASRAWL